MKNHKKILWREIWSNVFLGSKQQWLAHFYWGVAAAAAAAVAAAAKAAAAAAIAVAAAIAATAATTAAAAAIAVAAATAASRAVAAQSCQGKHLHAMLESWWMNPQIEEEKDATNDDDGFNRRNVSNSLSSLLKSTISWDEWKKCAWFLGLKNKNG